MYEPSFAGILANVPHDPASLFVYVLLVAAIGGIFWVGRPQKRPPVSEGPKGPDERQHR